MPLVRFYALRHWARIFRVRDSVIVCVVFRAAVFIGDTIAIFGELWALIDFIGHAISVTVRSHGRPLQAN